MKIVIVGTGYVGLSNAVLLAQKNEVIAVDIVKEKVNMINNRQSPIADGLISEYLQRRDLNLKATCDLEKSCVDADFVVIATPTNYDTDTNYFDTSSVESVLATVTTINPLVTVVLKSTVPVGFTSELKEKGYENVIFVPEFLREGQALRDNLFPDRIVIGENSERARCFARLLVEAAIKEDIPVLYTSSTEAEAIKLFANTFLAMRVSFFNELDTYAWVNNLNSEEIIRGVTLDRRIGQYYCNPSFGYGGYCLPKDTKQLLANFQNIPEDLIQAIVSSNVTRKELVIQKIMEREPKVVGVFRLTMKAGSDNFRASAVLDIIKYLKDRGVEVMAYEPTLDSQYYQDIKIENDINKFIETSDLIIANRYDKKLDVAKSKLITRDIFSNN